MLDAHVHLNQFVDSDRAARELADAGNYVFAQATDPRKPYNVNDEDGSSRLLYGVGYHPWWVAKDARQKDMLEGLELMCAQIERARLIGEVGLDFSRRYVDTKDAQLKAFEAIIAEATRVSKERQKRLIVSIHSIRAGADILNILKQSGAPDVLSICMHWFGGTSSEVHELKEIGAYFSWGEEALKVAKCREYAKIPDEKHMLLETDYPWRDAASSGALGHRKQMEAHAQALESALTTIARLRKTNPKELLHMMETNMSTLLSNDL